MCSYLGSNAQGLYWCRTERLRQRSHTWPWLVEKTPTKTRWSPTSLSIPAIFVTSSYHSESSVWIKASLLTCTISERKPPWSQTQWQAGMMPYAATEQKMTERSIFHSWVWYSGWIWAENTARIRARTVIRYTCLQNWGKISDSICLYNQLSNH